MSNSIAFRRATHDLDGNYIPRENWARDGVPKTLAVDPMHWMDCNRAMTFDEIVHAMQSDRTNFLDEFETPSCEWAECPYPKTEEIALGLVRLLEHGIAEVRPIGWTNVRAK